MLWNIWMKKNCNKRNFAMKFYYFGFFLFGCEEEVRKFTQKGVFFLFHGKKIEKMSWIQYIKYNVCFLTALRAWVKIR